MGRSGNVLFTRRLCTLRSRGLHQVPLDARYVRYMWRNKKDTKVVDLCSAGFKLMRLGNGSVFVVHNAQRAPPASGGAAEEEAAEATAT